MDINKEKILVTGINDMVGLHLLSRLKSLGATVTGIGDLHGDIGSLTYLENEIKRLSPKLIFHVPGNRYGIATHMNSPGDVYYESTIIFSHLLEAARKAETEKVVNVLSNCVYPDSVKIPHKEIDIWNGLPEKTLIPHGMARRMSIIHGNAYRSQYNIKTISVVLASVYGPNDNFEPSSSQVMASMINRFVNAKDSNLEQVICWGTGRPTREFIHVRDAVMGLIYAGIHYDSQKPLNIGSANELSIKSITEIISKITKYQGKIIWNTKKPDGRERVCLDCTRMKKVLPIWKQLTLEEGILDTINWLRNSLLI